jgi:hypothetical protein
MTPGLQRIADLDEAWSLPRHGPQLRAVRRSAERLRERFVSGPRCVSIRTLPMSTLAYPTRYAFWAAAFAPAPFVMMTHRCVLVQFQRNGELKNLLFNPTDVEAAKATPFFARFIESFGSRMSDIVAGKFDSLESQLSRLGVRMEDVVLTTGDLALGDGVMLLRTPGHTSGNQTLFLNTESGVWGISENGTCADNWSPLESRIKGLAFLCKKQDLDLVLNANTPELGALQYTSMIMERTIVDRVRRAPAFVQMFPSSEVTPSLLAPGLTPSLLHRAITHGEVARPSRSVTGHSAGQASTGSVTA